MNLLRAGGAALAVEVAVLLAGCATQVPVAPEKERSVSRPAFVCSPHGSVAFGEKAWSPDGKKYAREIEPQGTGRIAIFAADATEGDSPLVVLSAQTVQNDLKGLAWSPDSACLAVMYHGGSPSGVTVYHAETGLRLRHLPIDNFYHYIKFDASGDALLLADGNEGGKPDRLSFATRFSSTSGVNLPWMNYGWDVGRNPWGGKHAGFSSRKKELREMFRLVRSTGGRVCRVFIFGDLRSAVVWDEKGTPVSFDQYVYSDFAALLDEAGRQNVRLIPVLFDYTVADSVSEEHGVSVGEHPDIFSDPVKKTAMLNLLRSFIQRFGSRAEVLAWDVFNEPERAWAAKPEDVSSFVKDVIGLIRTTAPTAGVTVGCLDRTGLAAWKDAGLTIHQFHYYDAFEPSVPLDAPAAGTGMAEPILVGELEPTDVLNKLTTLYENGYAGALFWSLQEESCRQQIEAIRLWMKLH